MDTLQYERQVDMALVTVNDGRIFSVNIWQERGLCSIQVYDVTENTDAVFTDDNELWSVSDVDDIRSDIDFGLYTLTDKSIADYVADFRPAGKGR
jgi:hypothetical protein